MALFEVTFTGGVVVEAEDKAEAQNFLQSELAEFWPAMNIDIDNIEEVE